MSVGDMTAYSLRIKLVNTCEALRTCTVKLSIPVTFLLSQFTLYILELSVALCSSVAVTSARTMSRVTWRLRRRQLLNSQLFTVIH